MSSEKSFLISMSFLLTYIDVRTGQLFFRLLIPEWSFQISGAPAVCKDDRMHMDNNNN